LNASIVGSKGLPCKQRLCRHQGGGALICAHMDDGLEESPPSVVNAVSPVSTDTPGLSELLVE